jgi:uncharacterized membrane-anchored protein
VIRSLALHPGRDLLSGKLHARPPLPLATPVTISRFAKVNGPGADRAAVIGHLAALCRRYGLTPPALGQISGSAISAAGGAGPFSPSPRPRPWRA